MLSLIIKSYLTILISVGAFSLFIFLVGVFWIVREKKSDKKSNKKSNNKIIENVKENISAKTDDTVSVKDLESIAGGDKTTTLLDLARAYIETGQSISAKKILDGVLNEGSDEQKQEAQILLLTLGSVTN